jgi:hypothetical protein
MTEKRRFRCDCRIWREGSFRGRDGRRLYTVSVRPVQRAPWSHPRSDRWSGAVRCGAGRSAGSRPAMETAGRTAPDRARACTASRRTDVRGRWGSPDRIFDRSVRSDQWVMLGDRTFDRSVGAGSSLRTPGRRSGRKRRPMRWPTVAQPPFSRLMLLRSTARTRAIAREFGPFLAAAYPARHASALAAWVDGARWLGDAILWCRVARGRARVIPAHPPRGIRMPR